MLGLWRLTETPADLWQMLPRPAEYRRLLPPNADTTRQTQWLAGRVLAHTLLHSLLGQHATAADALLRNEASGRPWLEGMPPGCVVSLSHSGDWAAAVVSTQGRAGVDIEIVRDKAQRLAPKFLSNEELTAVAALNVTDAACFSLLWSAKETLYKLAAQRGIIFKQQLLLSLDKLDFPGQGELQASLILNGLNTRHRICYSQPAPDYVLTYSHEGTPPKSVVS
jgi:4'-phosphopantetheinyl transferase